MRETVEYEGQTYDKIPVSKENDCTGCCFYKGRCLLIGTGSTSPRCYNGKQDYIFKEIKK